VHAGPFHELGEQHPLVLVAGGVRVGDVMRDDIQLALQGFLAGQGDEGSILHRSTPWNETRPGLDGRR
jgi:hypothetical protein